MCKGGVIMDVTSVEQAQIAEDAGAVAVMVLDKLPADVRKAGGVARTASLKIIKEVMDQNKLSLYKVYYFGDNGSPRCLSVKDIAVIYLKR